MKKTAKKTKRRNDDVNVTAFDIVNELTAERPARKASKKAAKKRGVVKK
jgi:hypothetical protein